MQTVKMLHFPSLYPSTRSTYVSEGRMAHIITIEGYAKQAVTAVETTYLTSHRFTLPPKRKGILWKLEPKTLLLSIKKKSVNPLKFLFPFDFKRLQQRCLLLPDYTASHPKGIILHILSLRTTTPIHVNTSIILKKSCETCHKRKLRKLLTKHTI
jgi:hypothetical protein